MTLGIRRVLARKALRLAPMAGSLVLMLAAVAQEDEPAAEIIDEITVVGEKSTVALRAELIVAEDDVFDVFNAINSRDEFDIKCTREAEIGTKIKRRVCRPRFVDVATSDQALAFFQGRNMQQYTIDIVYKQKLITEEIRRLATEHELLRAALDHLGELQQEYDAAFERRREERRDDE